MHRKAISAGQIFPQTSRAATIKTLLTLFCERLRAAGGDIAGA
jgi:hypothetical protein